jgi:hypothetical protein
MNPFHHILKHFGYIMIALLILWPSHVYYIFLSHSAF